MNLRTKLFLILSTVVMATALSASMVVYHIAGSRLEQNTERRMRQGTLLVSELLQRRFDTELRKFKHWAAMPLVRKTALDYKNPELVAAFDNYFSAVVEQESYTSIYLINHDFDCVASDDPRRIFFPLARQLISKKPGAHQAMAGKANIGASVLSKASGRPVLVMSAPIFDGKQVVGILRSSIDMDLFRSELLIPPVETTGGLSFHLFAPDLPVALPAGVTPLQPLDHAPYQPPSEALTTAFHSAPDNIFRFQEGEKEHMAAFAHLQESDWVFLLHQPMDEILAPIRFLRRATIIAMLFMLLILGLTIYLITAPVVNSIELCREFASQISRGELNQRLTISTNDEVGQLAGDLNEMAGQLKQQQETREMLLRTELEMLRYQLNPHFFFNALNSLRELVLTAPEKGVEMIETLADYCRAGLITPKDSLTTIREELDQTRRYFMIQQVRFGERLQVKITATEKAKSRLIPPFILQPLVENAVKFGQKSGSRPLLVIVSASCDESSCQVEVSNSGSWFEPDPNDSGTRLGLENVRRRLDRYYGRKGTVEICSDDGRVQVRVRFPLPVKTQTNAVEQEPV